MSDSTGGQEDRTEAATPRRLQRAREEGHVPISRELAGFAGLAGAALALVLAGSDAAGRLTGALGRLLAQSHQIDLGGGIAGILLWAGYAGLRAVAPIALAAALVACLAVLAQTGALLHFGALRPDPSRIDPRAGLKRLFGADGLTEALKSCTKLIAVGLIVWWVLTDELRAMLAAPFTGAATLAARLSHPIVHLLMPILAVQAALAAADLLWVRLRHARALRMSRQDIREEQKETEGDPKIKQRIRQIRLQRARRRMLAAVPKATVVVTNPTHYAVALAYERARNAAPRVVAKGVDSMAARIREVAEASKVPLVSNPPLARALYTVELDTDIPPEHYKAVAEIIAYVWRLSGRAATPPR